MLNLSNQNLNLRKEEASNAPIQNERPRTFSHRRDKRNHSLGNGEGETGKAKRGSWNDHCKGETREASYATRITTTTKEKLEL